MTAATGMSRPSRGSGVPFALAPHRSQTRQLSTDPLLIDKARDVVGRFLFRFAGEGADGCVYERSPQIQVLGHSHPVLPMSPDPCIPLPRR